MDAVKMAEKLREIAKCDTVEYIGTIRRELKYGRELGEMRTEKGFYEVPRELQWKEVEPVAVFLLRKRRMRKVWNVMMPSDKTLFVRVAVGGWSAGREQEIVRMLARGGDLRSLLQN